IGAAMRERGTRDGCRCGRDITARGRAERHEDLRDGGAAPSNPERQSLPQGLPPIRQQYRDTGEHLMKQEDLHAEDPFYERASG
ncbi:hypothetical protein, partial [Microvirga tunisiensis]|uniref:hypothetical protein n=1 Tax=Microvirga tunisiensis TaxID=2108360 RepID=UPI001AEF1660